MNCANAENNECKKINLHTKKIITTITLLCKVLHNHMTNQTNQCPYIPKNNDQKLTNLLNHILIKDVPIKDTLNILIETAEISQLYSNHLTKYHSSKDTKQCLFSKHHLTNNQSDQKEQKESDPLTINSNFFIEIIKNSAIFANKLHITHPAKNSSKYTIKIIKLLPYNSIDLKDISFTFSDEIDSKTTHKTVQHITETFIKSMDIFIPNDCHNNFLTFNDIINAKLHLKIDYKFFFHNQNNTKKHIHMHTMTMLSDHSSDPTTPLTMPKLNNMESNASNATGMVYCSDYDENEMDEYNDYDCQYIDQNNLKLPMQSQFGGDKYKYMSQHDINKVITMNNNSSSPVFLISGNKKKKKDCNDQMSVKSTVKYDSNKFYIPFKGYGLKFKSQSNMSMNENLPCAGKMTTINTEGSVFCFDD